MRLLDAVATCTRAVVVDLAGELYRLPGAGSFADAVSACPLRYVLEQDIFEAAGQIATQWPDLLDPADPRMRVPAESLWIEWRLPDPVTGRARQTGMLVEAAIDGRSGQARSFWMSEHGPDAAQISLRFDLDRPHGGGSEGPRLYPVISASGKAASLAPYLTVSVDQGWHRYFAQTALGPERVGEAVQRCAEGVMADLLVVFAFARLLNSQLPMRRQEIDRSRLNAARLRTGKPVLLDHVELSLAIGEREAAAAQRPTGDRSPARLHLVRGHLVRRSDAIFWRSPHLRGGTRRDDKPAVKTIHARLR